jgi:hypothetical protein
MPGTDPMQTLAEWRKQVAVPVMQALDREVANSATMMMLRLSLVAGLAAGIALASHAVAAALADSAHVHVGGERHLIWRCLENGGCG